MQIVLLNHLRQHEYPTVYPILTTDQQPLIHETFGSVMLYPFLQGTPPQPSPPVLAQLGRALATLHSIPPPDGLPPFAMGISQIHPFFREVQETSFATHPFVKWLKSQVTSMGPYLRTRLPTGLIHGDLFLDNTLFDDTDQLLAILDFEEGSYDTLLIDIGMTIIGCCYLSPHRLNASAASRFLETYNALRPLTENEWKHLDCYVHYAALSIAFWRFRQFNIRHPDPNRTDTYNDMLTRSSQWTNARRHTPTKIEICL